MNSLDTTRAALIFKALTCRSVLPLRSAIEQAGPDAIAHAIRVVDDKDAFLKVVASDPELEAFSKQDPYYTWRVTSAPPGARLGFLIFASVERGRTLSAESSLLILSFLEELEANQWQPTAVDLDGLISHHAPIPPPLMKWVIQRGRTPLIEQALAMSIFEPTAYASAETNALKIKFLAELIDEGILTDEPGHLGVSDALSHHAFDSAALLAERGFKPRPLATNRRFNTVGMGAVASYIRLIQEMNTNTPDKVRDKVAKIEATLDWLAAEGAPFAISGSQRELEAHDPFLASIYNRSGDRNKPLYDAAFRKLIEHGANPNQSGRYLSTEVQYCDWNRSDRGVQEALAFGADPTLNPQWILSGVCSWGGFSRIPAEMGSRHSALAYFDKLVALGADPSAIGNRQESHCHPIAVAIVLKNYALAKHAHIQGVDASNIDPSHGQTILHQLAHVSSKEALECLRYFLSIPSIAALIDSPMTGKSDLADQGQTPLMVACGQLNLGAMDIFAKAGASLNLQDAKKWTALHHAGRKFGVKAQDKSIKAVTLLLEAGADPSLPNAKGQTPGQAMALRAPLGALSMLMSARPDDLTGSHEAAKDAQAKLSARGSKAISIVEDMLIQSEIPLQESAPANPTKRRL